jgi:YHS domain-containing protein
MEGLGSFLLFAVIFYLLMRYGCGAHMMHGGHGGHEGHGKSTNAELDKKHVDPVCDMEVKADQGYGQMYQGALYRFCSKRCLDKFDAAPENFINKKRGADHEM